MFERSFMGPPPLTTDVRVMLIVYSVILVPWVPAFTLMGTGMAFEPGYTWRAYGFVVNAWAYPILVGVAYFLRRRNPNFISVPLIPLILIFLVS
ncbi:MAG: hypothetical protein U0Q18_20045 [Bryobacteraceae bacterium]